MAKRVTKKINKDQRKKAIGKAGGQMSSENSETEALYYIADMLVSLRKIAQKEEMKFLVYFLDMACSEAVLQRDCLEKKQNVVNG